MSALYRLSFRIEQDEVVPDEVFRRLVSRPCRDLDLRGRLRWLRFNLHDVLVEGPHDRVERYLEYLRVGESITGILSMVNRMYITWYGLSAEFIYDNMGSKARFREREAARAERRDEDESSTEPDGNESSEGEPANNNRQPADEAEPEDGDESKEESVAEARHESSQELF